MKPNRIKKIIKILIVIILIILVAYFIRIKKINEKKYELIVTDKKAINYQNEETSYIVMYNTILVPMDECFNEILGAKYNDQIDDQEIEYNGTWMEINKLENKLKVKFQNSNENYVDVEIEEEERKKYIPLYLICNLPNTIVKMDGKKLYDNSNYTNGMEIVNDNQRHSIEILVNQKEKGMEESYKGEKNGALWREEAYKRIEKYRKKKIDLEVKNATGEKLTYNLKIRMINNEFNMGTAIRMQDFNEITREKFNLILSESHFQWYLTNKDGDSIGRYIYNTAKNNGYRIKGHTLWWDKANVTETKEIVKKDNDSNSLTMKKIYDDYNSGKTNENMAKEQIKQLTSKFENVVLTHIKNMIEKYPEVDEWNVYNEPFDTIYFKYFLYDMNLLKDNSFNERENKYLGNNEYISNKEYNTFIKKCFEYVKKNTNSKAILNFNRISPNSRYNEELIKMINELNENENNVDCIGIQLHIGNNYNYSPQEYNNLFTYLSQQTNGTNINISEYDNNADKSYTTKENKTRADYLRDILLVAYSNTNINEFYLWNYNTNNFCDEERNAYNKLVNQWLNYNESAEINNSYTTRLYKGTYEATITLPNGKYQTVNFEVSDDSSDTVNVVFDSELQSIEIKETPKTDYYRGDAIDLTEGSIIAKYNDGTSKEIRMSDKDIKILNFNTINNGKYTLTVQYNGCNTTFDINVKENIINDINKIIDENNSIKNNYESIYTNTEIMNAYNNFINTAKTISKNESENSLEKLDRLYSTQTEIAKVIVKEYNKKAINIENSNYTKLISDILDISNDYKVLYELYVTNDSLSNKDAVNKINQIIERYNNNTDIDLSNETNLINQMRTLYSSVVSNNNIADNYLDKQRILKTCEIVSLMLERDIKQKADIEYKAITISSDKGINNFTNQDETITINLPKNAQITSESSNEFKFNDNGTKDVKLSIRGYEYTYTIKVNNIDKTLPKVTAQNGQSIKINAIDDNLKEIKIEKDGKETAVNNGQTITTPGIYKIIATDKAGNSANETAIVYGTYTNEQNSQVNYITIKARTKVSDIKQDGNYTIKDNNNITAEVKRAPSSVNTNAEKDSNSYIATGDILQDNNNTCIVITLGDLSGNGDVGVADLIKLRKSLVGLTKLTKLQELAADTNQNGSINVSDLLKERKIMVEME